MIITPEELIKDVNDLVSLPDVCMKVIQMVNDPGSNASTISGVVSQDPGLTVRLLKIANSAFYGLQREVTTVAHAIAIIGIAQLRNLVLSTSCVQAFDKIPNHIVTMDNFWTHSLYCAIAAKLIAEKHCPRQKDELFTAGLLHDIGSLILYHKVPEKVQEILELLESTVDDLELQEVEKQLLGFDHAELGLELAKLWSLPVDLQEAIGYHHDPEKSENSIQAVYIIHIANSLAVLAELDSIKLSEAPKIKAEALKNIHLSNEELVEVIKQSQTQLIEVQSLFGLGK